MSVQQFCLRWNNHQPNFISVCSSLLHNGTLVDVTLAAEGRQLQAHKIVLSACSSYFQTLFTTNPCQHPIVILKDVQYDDLKTMVDFMYYGEVNVSQEQLPHILKTAEMLKIKGLAEMPTDPANLTKTDSKSLNDVNDLVGASGQCSSGSSAGLGSSTAGSDSLWGSTDSQFPQQQQQHHHAQQQLGQQPQQQQHHHHQNQQQQQQQQPQVQAGQAQGIQQHHQLRRTPSPLGANASPATRRKRLRKSSNNGSGERNNIEDPHNSSIDGGLSGGTGVGISQMNQIPFGAPGGGNNMAGMPGHAMHASKIIKETSGDVETHPQDSDSLEDGHAHGHMQIKPEVDIGVQQSMPLDISGATTPSEHDAPNSQSSHSGLQWTVVDSNYPRFSLPSCQSNLIGNGGAGSGATSGGPGSAGAAGDQQRQQHQQQQDPQQSSTNQQQQQQQQTTQHMQQLHYQQQQQQQGSGGYSPQIITVNNLVGSYAAPAGQQNMSPPSPAESSMVQSVYSQGPTPTQSPVHPSCLVNTSGTGGGGAGVGGPGSGSNLSAANTGSSGSNSVCVPAGGSGCGGGSGQGSSGGSNSNAAGSSTATGGTTVVKRKRSVNPQSDENFIKALEAVRSGGIGFCKAARLFGVNNRTLWLEYKKRGYPVSRPSIKARAVKQEPNLSPSPTPTINTNDDTTTENYEHLTAVTAAQTAALNMQIPPTADTPTPSLMCTPHHSTPSGVATTHPTMGVMSFLETRHVDFPGSIHTMSRQRYIDTSGGSAGGGGGAASGNGAGAINVNPAAAMNLQSINFNSI